MLSFKEMEKLTDECLRAARTAYVNQFNANNLNDADRKVIGKLAAEMLEYCLKKEKTPEI